MGKIILLMGKSASGKDHIYKGLLQNEKLGLKKVVMYTTRPMRQGEENGVQYFFTDEKGYEKFKSDRKIIEERTYNTMYGLWRYFTVDDGQIELSEGNYLMIGTLDTLHSLKEYFGEEKICHLMITADDGKRLEWALKRERKQEKPKYDEMCRRFLADEEDFSEERQKWAGVENKIDNNDTLDSCLERAVEFISENCR
ncbi:MAG: guanylate kinase [Butyrivibrio sp.]|nr:guanylate kinase [Butyrivibrio sp.]